MDHPELPLGIESTVPSGMREHPGQPVESRRTANESEADSKPSDKDERKRLPQVAYEWKVVSLRECPSPESMIHMNKPEKCVAYWNKHVTNGPCFDANRECLVVLMLNSALRIAGHHVASVGTLNETICHPRDVFRAAVIGGAYAIVIMHNHPSGEVNPSNADQSITRRLSDCGQLLQIRVVDHIIVGYQRYFSFKEVGML